jgi:hypothetical protein
MYVLSIGCQRRSIPKELPPRSTVHGCFGLKDCDGTLDRIHHVHHDRAVAGSTPPAPVIDPGYADGAVWDRGGVALEVA